MPLTLALYVGVESTLLRTRIGILRSAGYLVDSAFTVKEAVRRFSGGDFDLVVLCHSIPRADRDRLTCLIRAIGSQIPVISISANPGQCDAFATATLVDGPEGFLTGISEVLTKAARAWKASTRDRIEVIEGPGEKPASSSESRERSRIETKVAAKTSVRLAHLGRNLVLST